VEFISKAKMTAFGYYAPDRVVSNANLEELVETSDEWIVRRTGIRERRFVAENEFTSDICNSAVEDLILRSGSSVQDVDYIIVATVTPDYSFPSVSSRLQNKLGISKAGAIDISAACAGFVHGLILANALVSSGSYKKVLVVGGETLSKIMDFTDRASCVLFGDGAGAALIEYSEKGAFKAVDSGTFGELGGELFRTGLKTAIGSIEDDSGKIRQNGKAVFKWATSSIPRAIKDMFSCLNLSISDIDWFIPHSANIRIIESISQSLDIDSKKVLASIENFGNTSSASIPLALFPAIAKGQVREGDLALLVGYGGGLVWSATIIQI
jgi:3-oxoacyl-[acyl-carrier-protein] synthase III